MGAKVNVAVDTEFGAKRTTAVAGGVLAWGALMTAVAADNMTECAGAWGALLFSRAPSLFDRGRG